MRPSLIIAAVSLACATPAFAAEPRGLSLREAQTLPAPILTERVLGAVGARYTELERPSAAITSGRAFTIAFATAPRSVGYPGLCEAEKIIVHFGPSANVPATTIAHVQSVVRARVYRIVSDTAPLADGWSDRYGSMLATRCAAAGPVLPRPGMVGPGFFSGSYYAGGDFWAGHAYFGARVLAAASSAAATGTLPPVGCRDDAPRPGDRICDDPPELLQNLPMQRFFGFRIDRCVPDVPDLCVTATFSRSPEPGPSGIEIRIRTGLSEVLYPPPNIALREIRILAYTPIP